MDIELSRYYEDAVKLSYMLSEWSVNQGPKNRFVICSGGGPGIMEAANKGAKKGNGLSMGLNISLPFEQEPNKYITKELNLEFHYFFMRKFWFAYLAKALIIFPGGFGTLDELFEILTLIQTGKIKKKMPIVIYGAEFWKTIINFDEMVNRGVIAPHDLELFRFFEKPKDAFEFLTSELTKNSIYYQKSLLTKEKL
jgi:uncharacterized protein (TIGR00730 family)